MARTPSREAHQKVLDAALGLISERGIEGTSMDAIAATAGVSKATVYKHWTGKDELLLDLIRAQSGRHPDFDSGDPRADMVAMLTYLARQEKSGQLARIWPRIVGYAAGNPGFAKALQDHVFRPRRDTILRMLAAAAEKGGLRGGIDAELAMDLLIGPIMHRRFVSNGSVPRDLPMRVVDYFWKVFARQPSVGSPPGPALNAHSPVIRRAPRLNVK